MQSFFVYIILFLMLIFLAKSAEQKNNGKLVCVIVLVLSLVAGLRARTVGLDTSGYIDAIECIIKGRLDLAYGLEWSFRYMVYALSFVIKEPQIFLLLFAFITNALIVRRLWELRVHVSFVWAIFAYYAMFYMMSLNLMRQFVAIAIVFYATKYLLNGKNLKFLLWVFVAELFHSSAFIGVVLIYFNLLNWKEMNTRQRNFLVAITVVSPLFIRYVYQALLQYSSYLDVSSIDLGFMVIVKLFVVVVSSVLLNQTESVDRENRIKLVRFSRMALILGLLLTSLGYVFRFVDRIGLYFYIFESIYIGYIFKQNNTKVNFLIKIVTAALYVYIFINSTLGSGQGQTPYLFFWQ